MKSSQKTGGYAALVQALAFVLSPINFLILLPSLGLDPTTFPDPAQVLSVIDSPLLFVGSLIQFLLAATAVVIALSLYDRYGARAPSRMRWAVAAAVVASGLFLSTGMLNFATVRALPSIPAEYQLNVFAGVSLATDGLLAAAIFAIGWSFLLSGWAAYQTNGLPRILSIIMMLGGASGILAFLIPPLVPLGAIFNLIWSIWLGFTLIREK